MIRESLGNGHSCYRVGGGEFYSIGNKTEFREDSISASENNRFPLGKTGINGRLPTVAYGFSIFKGEGKPDFQRILKEADSQMYQYKKLKKSESAKLKSLKEDT